MLFGAYFNSHTDFSWILLVVLIQCSPKELRPLETEDQIWILLFFVLSIWQLLASYLTSLGPLQPISYSPLIFTKPLFYSAFGTFFLVHIQLIKSSAGSRLLNAMSLLYFRFTIITPHCNLMPWMGGQILNCVLKHLCLFLNWIKSIFTTWRSRFLICDAFL